MKRKLLYTLLVAVFIFISYTLYLVLNPVSPLETVNFSNKDKIISVTYSRPYKKDRLIFGNQTDGALVPYGIYWRTGANRHTVIETETDLNIMGNILKAGKYSLFTVPGNDSWDITFNSTNAYFGIMRPNKENDIFTVSIPPNSLENSIEQLTIDVIDLEAEENSTFGLRIQWDLTEVVIPFN